MKAASILRLLVAEYRRSFCLYIRKKKKNEASLPNLAMCIYKFKNLSITFWRDFFLFQIRSKSIETLIFNWQQIIFNFCNYNYRYANNYL